MLIFFRYHDFIHTRTPRMEFVQKTTPSGSGKHFGNRRSVLRAIRIRRFFIAYAPVLSCFLSRSILNFFRRLGFPTRSRPFKRQTPVYEYCFTIIYTCDPGDFISRVSSCYVFFFYLSHWLCVPMFIVRPLTKIILFSFLLTYASVSCLHLSDIVHFPYAASRDRSDCCDMTLWINCIILFACTNLKR